MSGETGSHPFLILEGLKLSFYYSNGENNNFPLPFMPHMWPLSQEPEWVPATHTRNRTQINTPLASGLEFQGPGVSHYKTYDSHSPAFCVVVSLTQPVASNPLLNLRFY